MVHYSIHQILFTLEKKAFILKWHISDNNKTIEIALCHVLLHYNMHVVTRLCVAALIFFLCFFFITCTNSLVWRICQGKLSASIEWTNNCLKTTNKTPPEANKVHQTMPSKLHHNHKNSMKPKLTTIQQAPLMIWVTKLVIWCDKSPRTIVGYGHSDT